MDELEKELKKKVLEDIYQINKEHLPSIQIDEGSADGSYSIVSIYIENYLAKEEQDKLFKNKKEIKEF